MEALSAYSFQVKCREPPLSHAFREGMRAVSRSFIASLQPTSPLYELYKFYPLKQVEVAVVGPPPQTSAAPEPNMSLLRRCANALPTHRLSAPSTAAVSVRFHASEASSAASPMLLSTNRLVEGILNGNRTALSRSITLVESSLKSDEQQAELLLDAVLAHRREASAKETEFRGLPTFRVGVAGPPGAGKSTFIENLGQYLTAKNHKVAVLAIDPSSSRSGGSLLGDKTRMTHLSNDPNAFVRPSPSRGTLGGVAQHTNDIVLLCEAAGYDIILVESVGLGQSEIVIDDTVDMVMLLVPPAGGDELQGSKKGIMEIADIIVVNKADGELESAAKHAAVDYLHSLQLMRRKDPDWEPKVKLCSAIEKKGIDKIWEVIEQYRTSMNELNKIAKKRNTQSSKWMWNQLSEQLMRSVAKNSSVKEKAEKMNEDLVRGFISPRSAAAHILDLFLTSQIHRDDK